MSKGKLKDFYKSPEWVRCRDAYVRSVGGLCERCKAHGRIAPAEIVHHKRHLTLNNVDDPSITLSPDNLMAVCRRCHEELHPGVRQKMRRYKVDDNGRIIAYYDQRPARHSPPSSCG